MQKLGGELAHHLGKRDSEKPLSNCWLYGFLKRWESRISTLKPSALESNRAKYLTPGNNLHVRSASMTHKYRNRRIVLKYVRPFGRIAELYPLTHTRITISTNYLVYESKV
ncbi:hypothetical protein DPMN_117242 [Dreissena polymorpha]|uniref:Uncharacterized protein n=1 Tax=Dreissena polymorpha TaxID=45954 RepID=A0A9D4KPM1_DREPO|nr:hypothetical protein DPMN_117242 [Dreissena polymorpha]